MHGTLAVIEKPETLPEPIAAQIEKNPSLVLIDEQSRNDFFADLKNKVAALPSDMESKKNREARRSMSAAICRSKKPIEDARKAMKAKIDATAKTCIVGLETLQDAARAPLDKWEDEEKIWKEYQIIAYGWTSDLVLGRLECAKETPCSPSLESEKEKAIAALDAAHKRLLQEEADAEELARLKAKEADELRRKDEEDGRAAELTAALDAKATSRPPATNFAGVRQVVQEAQQAQGMEPKFGPSPSAPPSAASSANDVRAKLTEIKEAIMRAVKKRGSDLSEETARAIVLGMKAGEVPYVTLKI